MALPIEALWLTSNLVETTMVGGAIQAVPRWVQRRVDISPLVGLGG